MNGRWLPAVVLGLGALVTVGIDPQRSLSLRQPLDAAVPVDIGGYHGREGSMSDTERRLAGVTNYLLRDYRQAGDTGAAGAARFTVYVGYYEKQTRGATIHSPKNCLPGSGWEPLAARTEQIATTLGPVVVNRYLLQHGNERALVLYWYQGRGRVASNEYRVKWELLRDAALRRRSDEALVRIVVPLTGADTESDAFAVAAGAAQALVPAVFTALPT